MKFIAFIEKKTLKVIQNERLFYHFLEYKTNLNTTHFKNLFSNWRLAIFFYGDFGPIDQFKNINHGVGKNHLFLIFLRLPES